MKFAALKSACVRIARQPADRIEVPPNRFYRNVAGSLSGTQEYMAAERLHALHVDHRFDLVIVDTPPTRNALDFLDAPTHAGPVHRPPAVQDADAADAAAA